MHEDLEVSTAVCIHMRHRTTSPEAPAGRALEFLAEREGGSETRLEACVGEVYVHLTGMHVVPPTMAASPV